MGSRSRSSTAARSDTSTQNLNLQEIDGVAVAGVGGDVRIATTDQGTVDAARDIAIAALDTGREGFNEAADVARDSIDFAGDTQERAFDFAGDVNEGFQESVTDIVGKVFEFAGGTGEKIIDATERIQARESSNTDARLEEITRVALIGAAILGAGAIYAASRG